jgi:hypothetical protein
MKHELAFDALSGTAACSFSACEAVSSVDKVLYISQLDASHDGESDASGAEPCSARNGSPWRPHAVRVVTLGAPIAQNHGVSTISSGANPAGLVGRPLAAITVGSGGRALTLRSWPLHGLGRGQTHRSGLRAPHYRGKCGTYLCLTPQRTARCEDQSWKPQPLFYRAEVVPSPELPWLSVTCDGQGKSIHACR